MKKTPWILRSGHPGRKLNLFCFCYAGGNAAVFNHWQSLVHPAIEICAIQLPGRGSRFHETPIAAMSELIPALADVIARQGPLPFAFFGHSMGALLAFEVARHYQLLGYSMPRHLIASGCDAPRYRESSPRIHRLSDEDFLEKLQEYNGTPVEVLQHRELMQLLLPIIRADFSVVEEYSYRPGKLLGIPLTVYAGTRDDHEMPEQVSGWSEETVSVCNVEWFDGDHFFINSHRNEVVASINATLLPYLNEQFTVCGHTHL